jgi:hypothetical protein
MTSNSDTICARESRSTLPTYLPTWEFRVCLPLALSSLKCDVMLKVKEITVIYIRHAHGLDRYDECTVLLDEYRFLSVTSVTGKIFL